MTLQRDGLADIHHWEGTGPGKQISSALQVRHFGVSIADALGNV